MKTLTQKEFAEAARGLPQLSRIDLDAEVVSVEAIGADYFRTNAQQRCIVRLKGKLFVSVEGCRSSDLEIA